MDYPEYLEIFSDSGGIDVEVRFKGFSGMIRKTKMYPDDLIKLIDRNTGDFFTAMQFDGHLLDVDTYQIDPIKNKLTIVARKAN